MQLKHELSLLLQGAEMQLPALEFTPAAPCCQDGPEFKHWLFLESARSAMLQQSNCSS